MLNTRMLIVRLLFSFLGCCLLLAAPLNGLAPVYAADPPAGQEGPVNPAFEAFTATKLQQKAAQQSEETSTEPFYGYIPHPVNLSQIDDVPVQKPVMEASTVLPGAGSNAMLTGLPATFDWWTLGKVTPVKNQNPCGACWIFGNLAALDSRVAIVNTTLYDFSEQNVAACVDPAWTYLINNKCNGGGDSFIAFDTLSRKGTRLELDDPYNTTTINTEPCNVYPTYQEVTGFHIIADSVITTDEINLVKNAVYNYGPVSMAFYWNAGYLYASSGAYTNVYYGPTTNVANHLVSVIGWNDAVPHPAGGGYGAWIVKNSWGPAWANSGYFYMCYGSGNMCEVVSYQGHRAYDANDKLYTWDEVGWTASRGWGTDYSAWMANVYTANPAGSLTHVDFWATGNNAQYQINVMNGSFGALLATQSGVCTELGYYSISLNSPIALTAGQQFTVAVKMTTPGWGYPIPVEHAYLYATPTFQPNVSFIKHFDIDAWTDLATVSRNAVLRARVNSGIITASAPVVANLSTGASNITNTTARLNGELISNGNENPTVHIYWGLTDGVTTPANWTNDINLGQQPAGTFYSDITGLTTGSTYYYRCYAINSAGDSWASSAASFIAQENIKLIGADDAASYSTATPGYMFMSRWAASSSGIVSTIRVKGTGNGAAKVAVYADSGGQPGALLGYQNSSTPIIAGWNTITLAQTASVTAGTSYWLATASGTGCLGFVYPTTATSAYKAIDYNTLTFSSNPSGITNQQTWYMQAAGWGTTVAPSAPVVTNGTGASLVTEATARLNGEVTSTGGQSPAVHVYWGDNDGGTTAGNWDHDVNLGTLSAGAFYTDIAGLTASTAYYYRCYAINSAGADWADSTASLTTSTIQQKLIGADDAASYSTATPGYMFMSRWAASSSGTVSTIKVKGTGAGAVKVAIYADSGSQPGTLLGYQNSSTPISAGWNTISLSQTASVTAGTSYWLATASGTGCIGFVYPTTATSCYKAIDYNTLTFSSSPSGITNQTTWYMLSAGWGSSAPVTPPAAPVIVAPGTSILFKWNAADSATNYGLQVSATSDFQAGTLVFDNQSLGNVTQYEVSGLSIGTTYYWRVNASNSGGTSPWSQVRSITMQTQ